jgi:hypothetical protein
MGLKSKQEKSIQYLSFNDKLNQRLLNCNLFHNFEKCNNVVDDS